MEAVFLLCLVLGFNHAPIQSQDFPYIPITVLETWEITYASDIQDICLDFGQNQLLIRSNGDGKIYMASLSDCGYLGEIDLPPGADGFGLAAYQGECYINSSTSNVILHSDGSDSWADLSNPAGTGGAGMDFDGGGEFSDLLCEVSANSPYHFHGIETDGTGSESFALPGVNGEISGFMGHELPTLSGYPPSAVILTTRYGHEFFFFHMFGDFTQYGQEPCPVPVSESLGLAWEVMGSIYWSYKGTDGKYYISKLLIPIFGGIEEQTCPFNGVSHLAVTSNPARGSAELCISPGEPGTTSLRVFDVTGRLVATLLDGALDEGGSTFSFQAAPGLYMAVLTVEVRTETMRFAITD